MPLNNGAPARNDLYQNPITWRQRVTFDGAGGKFGGTGVGAVGPSTTVSFVIPAGSIIVTAATGVDTLTVFNAATTNRVQIGISGAVSKYGLNITAATAGFAPIAVAVGHRVDVDTVSTFTPDCTGTAATTGDADYVLTFIPPQ